MILEAFGVFHAGYIPQPEGSGLSGHMTRETSSEVTERDPVGWPGKRGFQKFGNFFRSPNEDYDTLQSVLGP